MADFLAAVQLVLKHEGGFANNPNDPGGATNYGITQRVLSGYLSRPTTVDDVKNMSIEMAKNIYKQGYWSAIRGDAINNQFVANWCMDMAVLRGVGGAVQSMQQALGVTVDGVLGVKTLAALNAAPPASFLNIFRSLCVQKFAAIVVARPASLEFLPGWLKRVEEIVDVVNLLVQRNAVPNP